MFPAGSTISRVFREELALEACHMTFFLFISNSELAEFEESELEISSVEPIQEANETSEEDFAGIESDAKWIEPEMSRKVLEWC